MYEYADIKAYKPDHNGTHLKIFVPDRQLEEAILKKKICINTESFDQCVHDGFFGVANLCFIISHSTFSHADYFSKFFLGQIFIDASFFDSFADTHVAHPFDNIKTQVRLLVKKKVQDI